MIMLSEGRTAFRAMGSAVARALGLDGSLTGTRSQSSRAPSLLTNPDDATAIMPVAGRRSPVAGRRSPVAGRPICVFNTGPLSASSLPA